MPIPRLKIVIGLVVVVLLIGCEELEYQKPEYPNGPNVDKNGNPIPHPDWNVTSFWGRIGLDSYYDTGGDWYIMIQHNQIRESKFTQVYINRDPEQSGNIWVYIEGFDISDNFIRIDDPIKAYAGWTYYVMIYERYSGY